MRAAAAVLLLALGAAHAQRMNCDGTFDKVSNRRTTD